MQDIHTSSRAAHASERTATEEASSPQELARGLAIRKKEIEDEIGVYIDVLQSHGADLNTPLLDAQGFPRHDLDVAAIRQATHRIAMLRNDLSSVTSRLGLALEGIFTKPAQNGPAAPMDVDLGDAGSSVSARAPFAKVNSVAERSPASQAGLLAGDQVVSLGNVSKMADLPALVQANEDKVLIVSALRAGESVQLRLTPHKWEGRGLLGCHLLPV